MELPNKEKKEYKNTGKKTKTKTITPTKNKNTSLVKERKEREICIIIVSYDGRGPNVDSYVLYMSQNDNEEKYMTFQPQIKLSEDYSNIDLKWTYLNKLEIGNLLRDIDINTSIKEITAKINEKLKNRKESYLVFDLDTYNSKQLYDFVFDNIINKTKLKDRTKRKIKEIYTRNIKRNSKDLKDNDETLDKLVETLLLISACTTKVYRGRSYLNIPDRGKREEFHIHVFKSILSSLERGNEGGIVYRDGYYDNELVFSGNTIAPPLLDEKEDEEENTEKQKDIKNKIKVWTILFLRTNRTHEAYDLYYIPENKLKLKLEDVYDFLESNKEDFIDMDDILKLTDTNDLFEEILKKIQVNKELEGGSNKYKIMKTICIKIEW